MKSHSNRDIKVCLHKRKMGRARANEALAALLLSVVAFYCLLMQASICKSKHVIAF